MKIVVCVKYVPDSTGDRRFEADYTVDRDAVEGLLSELDEYGVEQALKIKEMIGDATVVVLTVGPAKAADAVRKALQMGADTGVHVLDDAIAGSDALATSLVLAEAVRKIGDWDIVLGGLASTDGSMGVIPAMLSERLRVPGVTLGSEITLEGQTVRIRRDGDTASVTVEGTLPLVASVTDLSGEPRYPSFKGIMAAKKKPVETWSLADLGVDAEMVGLSASWSVVEDATPRPPRSVGEIVNDAEGCGAKALVDFLAGHKFI